MSCGCGGCTDKIAALETLVRVLEGRVFSLEARMNDKDYLRNPFSGYPTWVPKAQQAHIGCPVCGIGADGKPMGYVCSNPRCPTRITCSTTGAVGAP